MDCLTIPKSILDRLLVNEDYRETLKNESRGGLISDLERTIIFALAKNKHFQHWGYVGNGHKSRAGKSYISKIARKVGRPYSTIEYILNPEAYDKKMSAIKGWAASEKGLKCYRKYRRNRCEKQRKHIKQKLERLSDVFQRCWRISKLEKEIIIVLSQDPEYQLQKGDFGVHEKYIGKPNISKISKEMGRGKSNIKRILKDNGYY